MANTLKFGNGNWATKEGSTLAYNDENGNFKPLPFDFTRASKATVINKAGLIETVGSGIPRIDFLGNTNGALLLEPSRTNLVLTSASGTYGNSPVSEENTISPDGTNNAVIPTIDGSADRYQYLINGGTYSTNTKLTYSWYRKRISTPMVDTYLGDLRPSGVNLSYVGDTKQIESNINGYDRFEAVLNITDGSATTTVRMYFGDVIGVGNSSIAYWGHQLEQGSYPTSYIPTQGSTVTRLADICSQTPPNGVIGQTEGAIYFEFEDLDYSYTSIARAISLSDGTSANRIYIAQLSSGAMYAITTGGCEIQETAPSGRRGNLKVAFGYKNNDCVLYVNGVLAGVDNSATTPICSKVHLGNFNSTANLNKPYKEVKLYNTRLSNAELQALTT